MTAPVMTDEATLRRILAEELERILKPGPRASMVTPEDFAAMLGVHQRTLRRLIHAGDVPQPTRVGPKVLRWHRDSVEEFMRSGRVDSQPDRLHIRRKRRSV